MLKSAKKTPPLNTENYNPKGATYMHSCRLDYSLEDYQQKIRMNAFSFSLLLRNNETEKDFFFKPKPRSLWVDEFQKDYLAPRLAALRKATLSFKYQFMTLTYDMNKYSPEKVAKRHKRDINLWVKGIRKLYPKFQYAYFIEVTKNLYVHFHLFISKEVKRWQAKYVWLRLTKSYIVHTRPINTSYQAIYYVNKYISKIADESKEKLSFMFKNIDRFFGCSRDFYEKSEGGHPKNIYSLICQLYIPANIYNIITEKKLINEMISADKMAIILGGQNMGLEFEYDEDGDLRGSFRTFQDPQAFVEYYLDFSNKQSMSWSKAINNECSIYLNSVIR